MFSSYSCQCCFSGRQWMYQTCTEFGFYQTSDSDKQPFGDLFPLKYVHDCFTVFLNG